MLFYSPDPFFSCSTGLWWVRAVVGELEIDCKGWKVMVVIWASLNSCSSCSKAADENAPASHK